MHLGKGKPGALPGGALKSESRIECKRERQLSMQPPSIPLRGIIFDMDGVLVDSHPFHRQAWRMFLAECGKEVSERELDFVIEGRTREEIMVHFLGKLSPEELTRYGALKDNLFRRLSQKRAVPLMPGVYDFLAEAKQYGMRLAVATSGARNRTDFLLGNLGVLDTFDAVVTRDEVSAGKPSPELFLTAASKIGLTAQQIVVFEDATNGIYAATAARMTCYGIGSGDRIAILKSAGALEVFSDFRSVRLETLRGFSPPHNLNNDNSAPVNSSHT